MTPLFGKQYDPDERPSTGELVGSIIIAIVCGFAWWLFSILSSPLAP